MLIFGFVRSSFLVGAWYLGYVLFWVSDTSPVTILTLNFSVRQIPSGPFGMNLFGNGSFFMGCFKARRNMYMNLGKDDLRWLLLLGYGELGKGRNNKWYKGKLGEK